MKIDVFRILMSVYIMEIIFRTFIGCLIVESSSFTCYFPYRLLKNIIKKKYIKYFLSKYTVFLQITSIIL